MQAQLVYILVVMVYSMSTNSLSSSGLLYSVIILYVKMIPVQSVNRVPCCLETTDAGTNFVR